MAHAPDLVLAAEISDVAEDVRLAAAELMPDNPGRCRRAGERYRDAADALRRYAERLAERGRALAPPRPRRPARASMHGDDGRFTSASLESRYREHR